MTHTHATLKVSQATYKEIAKALTEAGYDWVFLDEGLIDMNGIALKEWKNEWAKQNVRMAHVYGKGNSSCSF